MFFATDDAHGQSATQCFAVGHQICIDSEIRLGSALGQSESQEDFIKYECDTFAGTDFAQLLQPLGIGFSIKVGKTLAIYQGRIGRSCLAGVQTLQRVDQHTRNVVAMVQHTQGRCVRVAQCQGIVRWRHRIARAWLHIVPPAVVSASESHQLTLTRVVARQSHGLHDSLGARHVERHFVFVRNSTQALHVVQYTGMVGTQDRAQVFDQGNALFHAFLVEILTQQVNAIRTRDVDVAVAVHICQIDAITRFPKATQLQILGQNVFKLVGHTVLADELQVRDHRFDLLGVRQSKRCFIAQSVSQGRQCRFAQVSNFKRGVVGRKPHLLRVRITRHPPCNALGPTQMATQARLLSEGKLESLFETKNNPSTQKYIQAQEHDIRNILKHKLKSPIPPLYDFSMKK